MDLYIKDGRSAGYFNAEAVIGAGYTFNYITGGRGIGKTYGMLAWFIDNKIPFILMRRTQTEADLQGDPITSSLKPHIVRNALKVKYTKSAGGKLCTVTREDGSVICVICALSTIATLRGIDLTDFSYIVYDEFITEPHVKKLKAEGQALENAYETINRNRELEGSDPTRLFCLSNSLNLANDVFIYRDLIPYAESLIMSGEEYAEVDRNTLLVIAQHSPISEKKAGTVQYQSASEEYARMSIKNEWILNDFTYVKDLKNLNEYRCICKVGDRYIWKHKSSMNYYVTRRQGSTKNIFTNSNSDMQRFARIYSSIYLRYLDGYVRFDSYQSIALFEKYYK